METSSRTIYPGEDQFGTIPKAPKNREFHGNTPYCEDFARVAFEVSKYGVPQEGLGRIFGVSARTIRTWQRAHPEFASAIKRGEREHQSGDVERSLFQRATGMEVEEVHEEAVVIIQEDGSEKMFIEQKEGAGKEMKMVLIEGIRRKTIKKVIPPSDIAIMFWLQNRMPDEWKNVQAQHVKVEGSIDHNHIHSARMGILKNLGKEGLLEMRQIMEKAEIDRINAAQPVQALPATPVKSARGAK